MVQPINYGLVNPLAAIAEGVKLGAGMDALAIERQQAQLQAQQAQQAAMQQAEAQRMMQRVLSNPNATAADYGAIVAVNPKFGTQIKEAWERMSSDRQQNQLSTAAKLHSSLQNQRPDVAKSILAEQIAAAENMGDTRQVQQLRTWESMIDQAPDMARAMIGASMAAIPGGDKYFTASATAGAEEREKAMAPAKLTEAQAKAQSAAVAAKFAESNAVKDLEKKGWDIFKIQQDADIARQNVRIAAMNAATARESNDLKRQEQQLKLREMIDKRDASVREKAATVESARFSMDNMLNTADRILANPSLNDVIGTFEGRMPAVVSDQAADAIALIETLKSQAFLAQIPNIKGMGQLSNAEGEKLQAALQNLDRVQSEKQFRANLKEAQRLVLKARKNVAAQYGVPENVPDTPAAASNPSEIDALVKQYTGR